MVCRKNVWMPHWLERIGTDWERGIKDFLKGGSKKGWTVLKGCNVTSKRNLGTSVSAMCLWGREGGAVSPPKRVQGRALVVVKGRSLLAQQI